MFEENYFYHSITENSIRAFGSLFNSIQVKRKNGSTLDVGLSFANKEHFVAVIQKKTERINQYLPRMAFSFSKPSYNAERETNILDKISCINEQGASSTFAPVPYTFDVTLDIWTKYLKDEYQIVEQILPYFRPNFNVPIISPLGHTTDMDIELMSIEGDDNYESELVEKRINITTLTFKVNVLFYAPIVDGDVIRKVTVNYKQNIDEEILDICKSEIVVDPWDANPDDEFSIIQTDTGYD